MAALCQEGDRFKRAEMLIDIGTEALRLKFDEWLPPNILKEKLKEKKFDISQMSNRKQFDTLYKKDDPVSPTDMDLTLMVLVLRNTVLQEPHTSSFDGKPVDHEVSDGADVARLKFYRNDLAHATEKKLNQQQFAEISQTIIKVIKRFVGSRFDDLITCILKGSLDYRAHNITWHVRETMVLLPDALYESVLQPAKESVIQLNNQQPLYYSIGGAYIMLNISEFSSREDLTSYLLHVQNLTLKQVIFILNKLAELNLCQTKQDNSQNDITLGDLRTKGHATFPGSQSNLNSDLQEICLQCGTVKKTSKYFSMPIPMGDDGLGIIPRFCKCQKQVYDRHSNQYISTHSNTKIKPCKSPCLSYSQSSNEISDWIGAQAYEHDKYTQPLLDYSGMQTDNHLNANVNDVSQSSNIISDRIGAQAYEHDKYTQPLLDYSRMQTNNHLNANVNHVSQLVSNENVDGLTQASDNDPFIRKESDGHNVFCALEEYIRTILILCVLNVALVVSMKIIRPIFKGIFQSEKHATIATIIFALLCLVLMIHSLKE